MMPIFLMRLHKQYGCAKVIALLIFLHLSNFQAKAFAESPELVVQTGHAGMIQSVDFSPDDRYVATGAADGAVILWNAADGREVRTFRGHSDIVQCVAFSRNGALLASCSNDGEVILWDYADGKKLKTLADTSAKSLNFVKSIAFCTNSNRLIAGYMDGYIRVYDLVSGVEIKRSKLHSEAISEIALTLDDNFMASASIDGSAKLWRVDLASTEPNFELQNDLNTISGDKIKTLAFSRDGTMIATAGDDLRIKLWDRRTSRRLQTLSGHTGQINRIAFAPRAQILASISSDKTARIWNTVSGKELVPAQKLETPGRAIAFSSSGGSIAFQGAESSIRLAMLEQGEHPEMKRPIQLSDFSSPVTCIRFSPDGNRFAVASENTIQVWSYDDSKCSQVLKNGDRVNAIAFNPRGSILASAGNDCSVRLWDAASGRALRELKGHTNWVSTVCFSGDGNSIISAGYDTTIKIWNSGNGKLKRTIPAHDNIVNAIVVSPDGGLIASASADQTIKFWNADTGRLVSTLKAHEDAVQALAFSANGELLASGGFDGKVKVWNVKSMSLQREFNHENIVTSVSFSPDSKLLCSGGFDNKARVWDVDCKEQSRTKAFSIEHANAIHSVAFDQSGRLIATGGADRSTKISSVKGNILATVYGFDSEWAVVSPNGRFDASNLENLRYIHWRFKDKSTGIDTTLPVEAFMQNYYTPRLLARALSDSGSVTPAPEPIDKLNLVFPNVQIVSVKQQGPGSDLAEVKVVFGPRIGVSPSSGQTQSSGLQSLRLFREGRLVATYTPPPSTQDRKQRFAQINPLREDATIEKTFIVPLEHNEAKSIGFSAYAFNESLVKSETIPFLFKPEIPLKRKRGKAYVIAFGADEYDSERINPLSFAVSDARAYLTTLTSAIRSTAEYDSVTCLSLTSPKPADRVDEELVATKENLRGVLAVLAGEVCELTENVRQLCRSRGLSKSTPDDLIVIAFSSHGITSPTSREFYIVPKEARRSQSDGDRASTLIASRELTEWMQNIDFRDMVLIIDACHSGAATGTDFRPGPMESPGLGQLAYYKRMRIIAASQATEQAQEFAKLKHGLLTYALLVDGLGNNKADIRPTDGITTIHEWLQFAAEDVPRLNTDIGGVKDIADNAQEFDDPAKKSKIQTPSLFDFSADEDSVIKYFAGKTRRGLGH